MGIGKPNPQSLIPNRRAESALERFLVPMRTALTIEIDDRLSACMDAELGKNDLRIHFDLPCSGSFDLRAEFGNSAADRRIVTSRGA